MILVLASTALTGWLICGSLAPAGAQPADGNPYAQWQHGPPHDSGYFPLAVWLQDPKNAARYQAAGINLYVGLWQGPTERQLAALTQAGMSVICEQNEVGLAHRDDPIIVGWMHGDEPDNAQPLPSGEGWGPPIPPSRIVEDYARIKAADPTRPVLLNLGQGVAWDGWYGRGVRTNHPEDYLEYIRGGDIVSFDIYPVVHESPEVAGNLWFVPRGVDRLREWSGGSRIVWNCIECTRISNERVKPTPEQVRTEVWMSLIHGSQGIIYFVHQFKPQFCEWALLEDPPMLAGVTALNAQIRELAPVLNSPTIVGGAQVDSNPPEVPVDVMVKRHDGATYLFAVAMRPGATTATFRVPGLPAEATAQVLGEERAVPVRDGQFRDDFAPYAVHLYRIE